MNRTLLFITALFVLIFMSCQSTKKNNAERQNEVELVAEKQLAFPLDEQTYYLSISIYQFEENGKEYLHFENTRKSLYDIVIFDIENKQIAKRIPPVSYTHLDVYKRQRIVMQKGKLNYCIIGWCELLKNTYKAVFKLIEKQ